jgi:hypothetical protein
MFSDVSTRGKDKVFSVLNNLALRHEGLWGSGFINPHFLHLGTSWRWVVSFMTRPLYPRGKSPRYPLDRRLGGPRSRSGRRGEEEILDPTGTLTQTSRSSNPWPVAILTALVLRAIGKLDRCSTVRELHVAFKIPYVYDYITKLCRI